MAISLTAQSELQAVQKRAFCYLCARTFGEHDEQDKDHVPPSAMFLPGDRQPPLILPTHIVCNNTRSAEDQITGKIIGLLHDRHVLPKGYSPAFAGVTFPDGTLGWGSSDDIKGIIFRWVRGFHAALYNEPLEPVRRIVSPPIPERRIEGTDVAPVPVPEVVQHFVEELNRNRAAGTIDSVVCRNNQCRYECVWNKDDDGQWICIWGLDICNWQRLGDSTHFEPRDCVGMYRPKSGTIPASATRATQTDFSRGETADAH